MKRISGPSAVTDSKGNNVFRDDDAANGIPGTIVTADWLNTIQEELCAIVEKSGSALEAANSSQIADIILGARSDVPALADISPVWVGTTVGYNGTPVTRLPEEPPLATCESSAGLIVCTSDTIGLVRGGVWHKIGGFSPNATWATAATFGDTVLIAFLATDSTSGNVVLKCLRADIGPASTEAAAYGSDRTLTFQDASVSAVGVDHPVYRPTYDIHAQKTFLWGAFVDAQHFIYVQRVFLDGDGIDKLETRVIWVEADVNLDSLADTTTLSEAGASSPPNPVHLRHRICGGRLIGGSEQIFVALPAGWTPVGDVLRVLFIGIDDDNLEASVDADSAYNLFNGQSSSEYSSPLKYIPLGAGRGMIGCSGGNFYVFMDGDHGRVSWHCYPLPSGKPFSAALLDACTDPAGGGLIICSGTSALYIYYLSTLDVLTLRLTIPISNLAARTASASASEKHLALKGVSDGKYYCLPEKVARSGKAAAVYLPGLALTTRTPKWGPWIPRSFPSNVCGALGCDADGRACLALMESMLVGPSVSQSFILAASRAP